MVSINSFEIYKSVRLLSITPSACILKCFLSEQGYGRISVGGLTTVPSTGYTHGNGNVTCVGAGMCHSEKSMLISGLIDRSSTVTFSN